MLMMIIENWAWWSEDRSKNQQPRKYDKFWYGRLVDKEKKKEDQIPYLPFLVVILIYRHINHPGPTIPYSPP